jgi:hypothetical protein
MLTTATSPAPNWLLSDNPCKELSSLTKQKSYHVQQFNSKIELFNSEITIEHRRAPRGGSRRVSDALSDASDCQATEPMSRA